MSEAKTEFKQKLKTELKQVAGTAIYTMFGGDLAVDHYSEVIIQWLRKNKNLIQKLTQ